jgi:hypothetical protein
MQNDLYSFGFDFEVEQEVKVIDKRIGICLSLAYKIIDKEESLKPCGDKDLSLFQRQIKVLAKMQVKSFLLQLESKTFDKAIKDIRNLKRLA